MRPRENYRPTSEFGYNALVTKLKARFDEQYQDYLAAGGTPHHLSATQRWALDTIRQAHGQLAAQPLLMPDAKASLANLERLRQLWSVTPLDGRVEFALRGLRFQKPVLDEAITRLEALAFEHKLDVLADRHAESATLAAEAAIICTEALV